METYSLTCISVQEVVKSAVINVNIRAWRVWQISVCIFNWTHWRLTNSTDG